MKRVYSGDVIRLIKKRKMEITSRKVVVQKSAPELYEYLIEVKNFETLMPENISKFETLNHKAFVFALKGMPEIALEVKETNAPNLIVLGAISEKLPFSLTINIGTLDDETSTTELLFEGKLNTMMAMMVKSPLTKFLETLVSNLKEL